MQTALRRAKTKSRTNHFVRMNVGHERIPKKLTTWKCHKILFNGVYNDIIKFSIVFYCALSLDTRTTHKRTLENGGRTWRTTVWTNKPATTARHERQRTKMNAHFAIRTERQPKLTATTATSRNPPRYFDGYSEFYFRTVFSPLDPFFWFNCSGSDGITYIL